MRLALMLTCACSVYDASKLPGRGENSVVVEDGGSRDGGNREDARTADDCRGEEATRCRRAHADAKCVRGECLIDKCLDGYVDCDADAANGCEARLDGVDHCGLCGAACRFNRGSARCAAGRCELVACEPGHGDCDADRGNGCETDLHTIANCGSCRTRCDTPANGFAGCVDGRCGVGTCIDRYGDCNGLAADGCEQELNTAEHCGGCGEGCVPAHGAGSCESGSCLVTSCEDGWADCNGRAADGCETRLDGSDHCGGCGMTCRLAHVEKTKCDGENGCAIDKSCGEIEGCTADAPENGCEPGWSDCDGDAKNGCEADLTRLSDCGRCDNSCVRPGTVSECKGGQCEVVRCTEGFARCGGDGMCRSVTSDARNCGGCDACPSDRAQCTGGRCTAEMCPPNRADCDGNDDNGCETDLTNGSNCGACGRRCEIPNASGACRGGVCGIGECNLGFRDCDGDPSNGCEVDARTNDDCGECGRPCVAPNAETSCSSGQCRITSCGDGRADCNRAVADGCESDLRSPMTCGACENVCAQLPNVVSSSCDDSSCELVCGTGRADCDGRTANGCEADLGTMTTCGRCGNDCSGLANVRSASCEAGSCKNVVCDEGFADCNGDPSDGCERPLNTLRDCGACDRACAPAHGTGNCSDRSCRLSECDQGFDDCNATAADGCETALSTAANCGQCGNACGSGGVCNNGSCGCGTDGICPDGLTCCNGVCSDVSTTCFPFPCVPGTDRGGSRLSCGGCDSVCLFWCCDDPLSGL